MFSIHVCIYFFSIWNNSLEKDQPIYDPQNWGWKDSGLRYEPLWMTQNEVSKECRELIKCGCKIKCTARCSCKKANLPCTELCKCGGDCE